MKVLIFGSTGMVGQGVLRECLLSTEVEKVVSIGRTPVEPQGSKHRDLVHKDLWNYNAIESELKGFDACFFCLGTPSAGKSEAEYTKVTYDLTLAAAKTLARLNPRMTFIYVSGEGADSSENSKIMWARVRGKTENALLRLPFKGVYIFRPGIIQPLHGVKSKTTLYRISYNILGPLLPLLRSLSPNLLTTTEKIGRAMIAIAKNGADKKILSTVDFNRY